MADRSSVQRQTSETGNQADRGSSERLEGILAPMPPTNVAPANDNPELTELCACLPVTEDEVRLLHQYLGQEILALFS
jgi:hypothetical protein